VGIGRKRVSSGPPNNRQRQTRSAAPGWAARDLAHRLIAGVLLQRRPLDHVLAESSTRTGHAPLEPRDRAFARALAATVLRRLGELEHVLGAFLQRPLPKEAQRVQIILLAGSAQIVCLGTPPHAAVDIAVEAVRRERSGTRFAGLANAVLRRVAAEGQALLEGCDAVALDVPTWLLERWRLAYGADVARAIAQASLTEAPLDIVLKPDADGDAWAERLGARVLPTGVLRLVAAGRIEELPGYAEGAWWVQDAAAALVARAAGDVRGKAVADLCAAPGGKTAWLAASGAMVTAVDVSPRRLERLTANLHRLGLRAEVIAADAAAWTPGRQFDAVILDAPCTGTGTIRRHPDILRLKQPEDVGRLKELQRGLLANAALLVRPGGVLVYSTCSLEPEEGERQIEEFLAIAPGFRRSSIEAAALGADPAWLTAAGDLRTLPHYLPLESPNLSGLDGFYVARLQRHT
jgi:16S rRNA (cytosine967-C5)-methyltransferase